MLMEKAGQHWSKPEQQQRAGRQRCLAYCKSQSSAQVSGDSMYTDAEPPAHRALAMWRARLTQPARTRSRFSERRGNGEADSSQRGHNKQV